MNALSGRPIPGRSILSAKLAHVQVRNMSTNPPRMVARSRGQALELAWRRGAGQTDLGAVAGGAAQSGLSQAAQYGSQVSPTTDGAMTTATPGALPSPNASVYSSSVVAVSVSPGVNLRAQPNANAQILAGETPGTSLTVVGTQQNGWLNVQDPNGLTGWVYSAYVSDASPGGTSAAATSATPSILGGGTTASDVASSGLLGLAILGGAVVAAYYLL